MALFLLSIYAQLDQMKRHNGRTRQYNNEES